MAFHLLQHDREGAAMLSRALHQARRRRAPLRAVQYLHRRRGLRHLRDEQRDRHLLCVVETPADQLMIEQTLTYKGLYFVLMGRLSPLDGIGPKDIHLEKLMDAPPTAWSTRSCWPPISPTRARPPPTTSARC